jgi:hypothetical protein
MLYEIGWTNCELYETQFIADLNPEEVKAIKSWIKKAQKARSDIFKDDVRCKRLSEKILTFPKLLLELGEYDEVLDFDTFKNFPEIKKQLITDGELCDE